jgi:hypothetical protein
MKIVQIVTERDTERLIMHSRVTFKARDSTARKLGIVSDSDSKLTCLRKHTTR